MFLHVSYLICIYKSFALSVTKIVDKIKGSHVDEILLLVYIEIELVSDLCYFMLVIRYVARDVVICFYKSAIFNVCFD